MQGHLTAFDVFHSSIDVNEEDIERGYIERDFSKSETVIDLPYHAFTGYATKGRFKYIGRSLFDKPVFKLVKIISIDVVDGNVKHSHSKRRIRIERDV